jgi:hypothetical protein
MLKLVSLTLVHDCHQSLLLKRDELVATGGSISTGQYRLMEWVFAGHIPSDIHNVNVTEQQEQ